MPLYETQMCAVGDTVHGKFHTGKDLFHFGLRVAGQIQGIRGKQRLHGGLAVYNIAGGNILVSINERYASKGITNQSPDFLIVRRKAAVGIVVRSEMRVCLFLLFPIIGTYLKEDR